MKHQDIPLEEIDNEGWKISAWTGVGGHLTGHPSLIVGRSVFRMYFLGLIQREKGDVCGFRGDRNGRRYLVYKTPNGKQKEIFLPEEIGSGNDKCLNLPGIYELAFERSDN